MSFAAQVLCLKFARPRTSLTPRTPLQFLLAAAAVLLSVCSTYAQSRGVLTGSVVDSTGLALVGAMVSARGVEQRVTLTDSDGRFAMNDLLEGEYQIIATFEGFAEARRTVRVTAGEPAVVSMTLTVLVLERTVVTAARTGEADVQSIPAAVTVLSGADLQRIEAHTLAQAVILAPSVTFSQNTEFAQLRIRGIGTNAVYAGSDPSAAVYLDGVYLARPAMVLTDLLALDRIEVLRGPQGTLYGRNAVGGAVNLITRAPTIELEASTRLVAGTYGTLRAVAQASGPLVRGRILASGAFVRGVERGFVEDLNHPGHNLGGEDVTAARGQVQLVLNSRMGLLFSGDLTHQDPVPLTWAKVLVVKPGFQVDNPPDLHQVRTSTVAVGRNLQYGSALRFTADITRAVRLTSLFAHRRLDYRRLVDTDITELELNATDIHDVQHQLSEELTISGQHRAARWIAGMFLFNEVEGQPTSIRMEGAGRKNRLDPRVEAASRAVFGEATVRLAPRVSAIAGLRYTRERKTIDNTGYVRSLESPRSLLPGSLYAYTDMVSDDPWTPKFGVEFNVRPGTLAYVSATRGFKSGGFNLTSTEEGRGYAPEWAWSYEAGLKTALRDGRARLNAAVFTIDYSDLQVSTGIRPGVIDISNAAAATIRGVELDATGRLSRRLDAGGHVTWLDARSDRYIATGVGSVMRDVAGHRLTNAPEWSSRLWLQWTEAIGPRTLLLRSDAMWQSVVFFTAFNDIEQQRPYVLVNANAEFGTMQRGWSVGAYVRNLANQDYITGTFGTPAPAIGARPGDPRRLGVQLIVRR